MIRVHSTCASGASAMPVPGCPALAFWGPSMQRPRMTLIARCWRSVSVAVLLTDATLPSSGEVFLEQQHGRGEAVQEAALADGSEFTGAEHARGGAAGDVSVHDLGV